MTEDLATGSWLLAAGTWFHERGLASGTESALLKEYFRSGAVPLARSLEGPFTIVIGDARTGETIVITDPTGSALAFVRHFRPGVAIGGSSLMLAGMRPTRPDPIGVQEYLRTGILFGDRTIHQEIKRLDAGTVHRYTRGNPVSRERYWSYGGSERELTARESPRALLDALSGAARKIQALHPRPVCDLTGGYDSRMVLAGFLSANVPFSTTVTGVDGQEDVMLSGKIARVIGLDHEFFPPRPPRELSAVERANSLTDGEFDPVEYAAIATIHDRLSRGYDASVNGSSGEIARGRWWRFLGDGGQGRIDLRRTIETKLGESGATPDLFRAEGRFDCVDHVSAVLEKELEGLEHLPYTARMDWIYLVVRMRNWQARIAATTDQIWPSIAPFLMRSVFETVLRIPAASRLKARVVHEMLARYHPNLARIPLSNGYPPIPLNLATAHRYWTLPVRNARHAVQRVREMAGIPPSLPLTVDRLPSRMHLWTDQSVRDLLDPRNMLTSDLFEPEALERFLSDSQARDFRYDKQWGRVLGLEMSHRVLASIWEEARSERLGGLLKG